MARERTPRELLLRSKAAFNDYSRRFFERCKKIRYAKLEHCDVSVRRVDSTGALVYLADDQSASVFAEPGDFVVSRTESQLQRPGTASPAAWILHHHTLDSLYELTPTVLQSGEGCLRPRISQLSLRVFGLTESISAIVSEAHMNLLVGGPGDFLLELPRGSGAPYTIVPSAAWQSTWTFVGEEKGTDAAN
jgi:hypothetical protein